ncbi:substrate-binding domain-containing protein [Clostridium sp. C105KSO13]|uniref:substrate-binding domain-containing protein n=1 Tax=Clostridium sp. C105KSO13 TaxID=1776045 RepID=UPI001FA7EB0A|nr:substrate-binding domain-containing protein [Clostridium sp. C105KSO13]
MTTIREVAKKANAGIGTVSRALNGTGYVAETKKREILSAAEELGYKIPERKRKNNILTEKIIGVIVPDISMPFYGNFVKYVEIELAKTGYKTLICNTLGIQGRVLEVIELAEKGIIQGIIMNADVSPEELKRLEKLPVISFERLLGEIIPFVASEHKQGGRKAGEILYKNRCMNVLIITAKHITRVYADYRIEECRKYLEKRGVNVTVAEYPAANVSLLVVEEVVKQYMELYYGVDGVFADDITAYCYLENARQLNIDVPRNLKIVGYDGNDILKLSIPKITTIKQDVAQIARTCAELIQKRTTGEKVEKKYFIPVKVEKGGTTK